MTRTTQEPLQRVAGIGALIAVFAILAIRGGGPGIVFGLAAIVAWLAAPPVFAFVIAQAALAAVMSPPYDLRFVAAELATATLLLADTELPITLRTHGAAVCLVAVLIGGLWLVQPTAIWVTAISSLVSIGGLLYAGHRYELLTTAQLER